MAHCLSSLALAMRRGCSGDALLLKQVQCQLLSLDECRALLADLLQLPLRPTSASELALGVCRTLAATTWVCRASEWE